MRVNALVVDLALLGPSRLGLPRALTDGRPGHGHRRGAPAVRPSPSACAACGSAPTTGSPSPAIPKRSSRASRRSSAAASRPRAATTTAPIVAGELEIRADQFQAFAGGQRRPHAARVRGPSAARARRGQGPPARGDLPAGLGLRDGPRRPLGRRLHPQGPPEARGGFARLGLHPHALRRWLPVRAGAARGPRRQGRSDGGSRARAGAGGPLRTSPRATSASMPPPTSRAPASPSSGGRVAPWASDATALISPSAISSNAAA